MKALIFGVSGQDGFYLTNLLKAKGIDSIGISRLSGPIMGDVQNRDFVHKVIAEYKPAFIFHLAAISSTRHDFLLENHNSISLGTLNILESVYRVSPETKVFVAGSGLQFHNSGKPIDELSEFYASSPYALARIHSVYACRYFRSLGVKTYVGYLFHHDSPLRKPEHVSMMVAKFAKEVSKGKAEVLKIGDLTVEKEWGFAGDIVEGMFTLVSQDEVFEAIIGTGKTYSIENWCEACFSLIGADWKKYIRQKAGFVAEYKKLVSNPALISSLGWKPKVSFDDLARMMVETH